MRHNGTKKVYKRKVISEDDDQDFKLKLSGAGYPINNYLEDFKRERRMKEERDAKIAKEQSLKEQQLESNEAYKRAADSKVNIVDLLKVELEQEK